MLKKLIVPVIFASLLGGCFVSTHGHGHARRGPCPSGYTKENGVCKQRGKHKGHNKGKKDVVIIRDHRR